MVLYTGSAFFHYKIILHVMAFLPRRGLIYLPTSWNTLLKFSKCRKHFNFKETNLKRLYRDTRRTRWRPANIFFSYKECDIVEDSKTLYQFIEQTSLFE